MCWMWGGGDVLKMQTQRRLGLQLEGDPARILSSAVCIGFAVSSMLVGRKRVDVLEAIDKNLALATKISRFVVERWAADALEGEGEPSDARLREMVDQIVAMKEAS